MTCLLIGEQLLHGYDIAQTLLAVEGVLPLLPAFQPRARMHAVR